MSAFTTNNLISSLFQQAENYDFTFGKISPVDKLNVSLENIAEPDEFGNCSTDIFEYEQNIVDSVFPTLSLGAKTASALLLSDRYISTFFGSIAKIHSTDNQVILPSSKDEIRIRKLIKWGFRVDFVDKDTPHSDEYRYNGYNSPDNFRTLTINICVLREICGVAEDKTISEDMRRKKLRAVAAYIAVALMREVSRALHVIVRPDYFLDSNLQFKNDINGPTNTDIPVGTVDSSTSQKFVNIVEAGYWRGAHCVPRAFPSSTTGNESDGSGLFLQWATDGANAFNYTVSVRSSDFREETYNSTGMGLFGAEFHTGYIFHISKECPHGNYTIGATNQPLAQWKVVPLVKDNRIVTGEDGARRINRRRRCFY